MSSKTYIIIGRVFTKKYGYLASFTRCDYIANSDKEVVDEVMDNLSYEAWVESHIGEPEYLGDR